MVTKAYVAPYAFGGHEAAPPLFKAYCAAKNKIWTGIDSAPNMNGMIIHTRVDKDRAAKMFSEGSSRGAIAREFGVTLGTINCWLFPEKRRERQRKKQEWKKKNPEKVAAQRSRWWAKKTPEQKDEFNKRNRVRYASNTGYREKLNACRRKYRETLQFEVAYQIRLSTLSYCGRWAVFEQHFMSCATGITKEQFASHVGYKEQIDHIVPLSRFNLSLVDDVLRACHPTNVRTITALENQQKGDKCDPKLKIESLPFIDTEEARAAAAVLIYKSSQIIERRLAKKSQPVVKPL